MATGALVLAISAVFATKANKKFATVGTAAAANSFYKLEVTGQGSASIFTTTGGGLRIYAQLVTVGASTEVPGTRLPMYTAGSTHDIPVYYK